MSRTEAIDFLYDRRKSKDFVYIFLLRGSFYASKNVKEYQFNDIQMWQNYNWRSKKDIDRYLCKDRVKGYYE